MRSLFFRPLVASLLSLLLTAGAALPAGSVAKERASRDAPTASPGGTHGANDAALAAQIDRIIDGGKAEGGFWGIEVRALESGQVLYEHNAERPFLPASNMKVFTSSTALDALGPEHRYKTTLYFDGEVDGSVLRGDLIVKGSGDPTFGSSAMPGLGDPLARWAQALAQMGVTRITGRLIGDDDVFGDRYYAEGWDVDYVTTQSSRLIGVSVGGLPYKDNLIRFHIRNGKVGEPPRVSARPQGFLNVINHATTSARRRGRAINVTRPFGQKEILLRGSVPSRYGATLFMPVTNPTAYAIHSFQADLRQAGIGTDGLKLADIDNLDEKPQEEDARPLFVHYSPPLANILQTVNKESNNFYADHIFRSLSASGTARASANREKALLKKAGVDTDAFSIRDGSGLSRKDLVTPAAMTKLLRYMAHHRAAKAFRASLAHGGERESTLKYRLKGLPVHAKTGSLEFVRALSGYATLPDGREVSFSLLANNYSGPSYRVTQTFDRIMRAMTS